LFSDYQKAGKQQATDNRDRYDDSDDQGLFVAAS